MNDFYLITSILMAFFVTFLTRAIPFIWFAKKTPGNTLKYIELYMPMMIMVILVFYAIKDVKFLVYPFGMPELFGILITFIIHIIFKQALLSIFIATIFYMYIVQNVL